MNYIWIEDGIVTNFVWLNPRNAHEFPNAIPVSDRPVSIGDTYDGSDFYRDGEKVLTPLEEAQAQIAELEAYHAAMQEVISG